MTTLSEGAKALLDAPNYAVLGTLNPDGSPQLTTMWVGRDGDQLLFSTVEGRQKPKNLARDPRVSVMIMDPESPFRYLEVRGTAEVQRDEGSLINDLSHKYVGQDYATEPEGTVRVVVRVTPTKVIERK
ncbi:PPOX class F420-dependent oxidoreductase [Mariniluteicoccus flavus]